MKKLYFLFILLFASYGLYAQPTLISDFESNTIGTDGGWGNWGGAHEVAANPFPGGLNTSTKVLSYVPASGWQGVDIYRNEGVFSEKPQKVKVLVYGTVDATIKLDLRSGTVAADEGFYKNITAGAWTALEYDISGLTAWDYKQLAFQNSAVGTFYFDDVYVVYESPEPVGGLLYDFENFNIGDQIHAIGWGGMVAEIADDPKASGNKVLKFTPNNYNSAPVLKFTLDEGKSLADYKTFRFKGFFAQGDVGWKDIYVVAYATQPTGQFQPSETIGSINRALGASTVWEEITINIAGSSSITGEVYIAFGINCAGTGDQGGTGVATIWYSDNVRLIGETTNTSLIHETKSRIYTGAGFMSINDAIGSRIEVYSMTGAKMFEKASAGSSVNVSLPKGIYIVVVDGVSTKVVVK